jgi:putative hydrolase of the HAD superfamily
MARGVRAVLLDFYGTLARNADPTFEIDEVLAKRGYRLPDGLRDQMWNGDLDGIEHVDQSRSREHYTAWQQQRLLALLTEADVHPGEHDVIVAELEAGRGNRALRAYPEVPETLRALRAKGLRLAICSNWDWDLESAVAEAGLEGSVDVLVSSAWAGARKPHPRIFRRTLEQLELGPRDVAFVGDTWGPDVDGPRALEMCAIYLEREGHWPDPTLPSAPAQKVARVRDLTGLLELL